MNQVVLIGRLIKDFTQKEDMFVSKIRLTNDDANEISFRLTNSMYENLKQFIRVGSIIGVKVHLSEKGEYPEDCAIPPNFQELL